MNIAQYTNKLKAIVPSSMSFAENSYFLALQEKASIIDIRQMLITCGGVICFYLLIFAYVYFSAETTIEKMEEKMASINVEVTKKTLDNNQDIKKLPPPKKDISSSEITKANLIKGLSAYDKDAGPLPIIRSGDHLTSFRAYQMPFSLKGIGKKPVISFILKDYGLSDEASNMALDILPPEISFILSPYADLPQEWLNRARASGHEVWLELPVQRDNYDDTGFHTIYHHDALIEKGKAMRSSLARALGYVGVAIFMDEGVHETKAHYIKLAEELYGRGLAILEMNLKSPRFIEAMALTKAAPFVKISNVIEHVSGINPFLSIEYKVEESQELIALVDPYPVMMKDLALWIKKIGKADYVIAPASAIYDVPIARSGALINSLPQHQTNGGLKQNDLTQPEEDKHGHADANHHH